MARIRSMKPELRTSLTAAQWPREVRYFWSLLWGYLDDHGYGVDNPKLIKADCFPLDDDLTAADIDKWLDLIASTVLGPGDIPPLCRYEVDGQRFLHATKWANHQRPQHPAVPKHPLCDRSHDTLMRPSPDSLMRPSGDILGGPGKGGEQNGITAGQTPGEDPRGESHETLTPEQVVGAGIRSREQVAGVAHARASRSRPEATLLGTSLLEQHKRHIRPSPPRSVVQKLGERIDELLDDPAITPDEVKAGLARLRTNPKWGPGMLPNLVHEIRQERAGNGGPPSRGSPGRRMRGGQDLTDETYEGDPLI